MNNVFESSAKEKINIFDDCLGIWAWTYKLKEGATALATGTLHLISALNDFTESDPTLIILQKYGLALACKRWVKFWHQSSSPFMTSWSVFPPIKQLSLSLCHQWLAFTSCSNCVGQMNFCKLLKGIRLCYTSYINFLLTLE